MKKFIMEYRHASFAVIYLFFYMMWFTWLEKNVTKHYTVIHVKLDDYIPFCEAFIIPYLLWFAYVAGTVLYLMFTDKTEYYRVCAFLFTGMTIFLIISTLFPNGHHLRPADMPRDNIFTYLVEHLYRKDTSTNIWPSIHVFNSLGSHFAIMHSPKLKHNKMIRIGSGILAFSIVLSTVFLKQHSAYDVFTAFAMAAVLYVIVYKYDIITVLQTNRARRKAKPQIS